MKISAQVITALGLSALWFSGAAAQQAPPRLADFLQQDVGLSAADWAALQNGQPVTRVVPMKGSRDIGVFGAIAVNVPRAFLVERIKDFPQFLSVPTRPRFGLFDQPATLANVQ